MKTVKDVRKFYNGYSDQQIRIGLNLRHYTIFNQLKKNGLKRNSSILEVGCGIGTLTSLIYKFAKKGKYAATDISDKSIEIAKKRISHSEKIDFIVTDMVDFKHPEKFDFVIFPDVLEHIPIEQHEALFQTISRHIHEQSRVVINIPHPKALDYIREHKPEKLQIIDQSISANTLISNAYSADLELISYNSYSLFNKENDYVLAIFKKNTPLPKLHPLPQLKIIQKKSIQRLIRLISKLTS